MPEGHTDGGVDVGVDPTERVGAAEGTGEKTAAVRSVADCVERWLDFVGGVGAVGGT